MNSTELNRKYYFIEDQLTLEENIFQVISSEVEKLADKMPFFQSPADPHNNIDNTTPVPVGLRQFFN